MASFRLTAEEQAEDSLHENVAKLLAYAVLPGTEWTTFPAGGYKLSEAAAARLHRLGLKPSWPDIQFVNQGRYLSIELKTGSGRLSRTRMVRTSRGGLRVVEGQEDYFPRLEASGARIAVCRSLDDVVSALVGWEIPLRGGIARSI